MGKDITKTLFNIEKSYTPWALDHVEISSKVSLTLDGFDLLPNSEDDELSIDRDFNESIELAQVESFDILQRTKNLNLYSSVKNLIELSETDLELEPVLKIPEEYQLPLITLQDRMISKLKNKDCLKDTELSHLGPKNISIYKKIGVQLSSQQTIDRLCKHLQVIPTLTHWEEVLLLTKPDQWSSLALLEITRLFISQSKLSFIKQYFQFVLLPLFRTHPSISLALETAARAHPTLFVRGFILPLCDSQSCRVSEAILISNLILQEPKPNSMVYATALSHLAQEPFCLPNAILFHGFLKTKQRMVSYRVLSTIVSSYFCSRLDPLPSIWYQSLLLFVETYGLELTSFDVKELIELVKAVEYHDMSISILQVLNRLQGVLSPGSIMHASHIHGGMVSD